MKRTMKHMLLVLLLVFISTGVFVQEIDAAETKLSKPQITISNVKSSGKIKLTWKKVKKAVSYKVYRSTDGKKWKCLITTKKTSVVNTSATTGKKYYYKVKAIAPEGMKNSSYSKVKYRFCDLKRPELKITSNKETGRTVLKWGKIDKAKSYKVYVSTDNKEWKFLKTVKGTKFTHTSAKSGKKYYYKVKAIASNSSANSAYSNVKSRTYKAPQKETQNTTDYQKEVADLAVEIATEWKTDYRSGKTGQQDSKGVYGFDCSGFATYVINTVMQKEIPCFRLTANISKFCKMEAVYNEGYPGELVAKTVSFKNIQPGDVIFFSHSKTNDHCGIYVGDNKVVHCSNSKGGVVMNEITGYLERDLSIVRRYLPETVTAANTKKTIAKGCSLYSKRADDDSKMMSLKKGSTVTVLFTGNSPDSYNQAYVKTSGGKKGFVYTKNLK